MRPYLVQIGLWGWAAVGAVLASDGASPGAPASPGAHSDVRAAVNHGLDSAIAGSSVVGSRLRLDWSLDPDRFQPEEEKPFAAPAGEGDEGLAKKLANPIADLISVPLQFNYDEGFGPSDGSRLTLNIQPVIPFSISEDWNLITRTIVPVIYQESLAEGLDSDFGLGDTLQSFFISPKDPVKGWTVGAGPAVLWPTGTEPALRSESVAMGPTIVALRQEKGWTYGALANHLWSVTSSDGREQVNSTFLQPFVAYTWPTATTLTLNAEAGYDWSAEEWNVPLNALISQVLKVGGQPISLQLGGRYYADSPEGGAEWGIRFTITFLFPR